MDDRQALFERAVTAKAARKLHLQAANATFAWSALGIFGVIGWSVVVPTLAGAALGAWIDRHHSAGVYSWTLVLLFAGLLLGCANAWRWLSHQIRDPSDGRAPGDE